MQKTGILAFLLASAVTSGAFAMDDLRQRQVQACTGDAFRLCSDAIPNESRVTVCMAAKRAQLSQACRAVFDLGRAEK